MKYLFLLFLLLITAKVSAQGTLHLILIADTEEAATAPGREENLRRMLLEADTISQLTGLQRRDYVLQQQDVRRTAIEKTLLGLECKPEDVVIFYFSGSEYIGKTAGATGQVIKLKDGFLDLDNIRERIGRKKPRLSLVLADLCNQTTSESINFKLQAASREKYVALFLESGGEISGFNHVPREQAELSVAPNGTVFTLSFLEALHETRLQPRWSNVISRARFLTVQRSAGQQNPQVRNEITTQMGQPVNQVVEPAPVTEVNAAMRTSEHNGNFVSPVTAKHNPLTTKGGNFIKPDDIKAPLSAERMTAFKEQGLKQVETLQQKIILIMEGSSSNNAEGHTEAGVIESAMLLFSDNNREIEISHLSRAKARVKVKKYFGRLYGMSNRYRLEVKWYKPAEIEEFHLQKDGSYKAFATMYQEFRKTNDKGKLIYGDRSIKRLDILLTPQPGGGWKLVIGDIKVVEGSTESIID